jgi:hypothetical protein
MSGIHHNTISNTYHKQPQFLRLFVINGAFGILMGIVMAGMLIFLDIQGLGELSLHEKDGAVAIALLAAGLAITFGGAAIATAIMLLDWDEEEPVSFQMTHHFFIHPPYPVYPAPYTTRLVASDVTYRDVTRDAD